MPEIAQQLQDTLAVNGNNAYLSLEVTGLLQVVRLVLETSVINKPVLLQQIRKIPEMNNEQDSLMGRLKRVLSSHPQHRLNRLAYTMTLDLLVPDLLLGHRLFYIDNSEYSSLLSQVKYSLVETLHPASKCSPINPR